MTNVVDQNEVDLAATFAVGPDEENASDVINPATGRIVARYRRATVEDVDAAVRRAKEAFKVWGSTPAC